MLGREPGGLSAAAYDVAGRHAMSWSGRLLHIHIAKRASLAMEELDEAKLVAGRGIEGDRYFYGTGTYSPKPDAREVTLIEMEVLEAIARGDPPAPGKTVELAPADHRRNLTTIGVPLGHLVGRRLQCRRSGAHRRAAELSLQVSGEAAGAAGLRAPPQSLWAQLPN